MSEGLWQRGLEQLRHAWLRHRLTSSEFAHLLLPAPEQEWVSLDCETTGLKVGHDEIIAVGAVRIVGDRVLASESLQLRVRPSRRVSAQSIRIHQLRDMDVADGMAPEQAVRQLLHFIGPRPLVGYYLEFDVAMLNQVVLPLIGLRLPQRQIEVSALYHRWKIRQLPLHLQHAPPQIDLRLDTLMRDLGVTRRKAHEPLNDAVMAALAFIKLRHLLAAKA